MNELIESGISGLLQAYRSGSAAPVEVCRMLLEKIEREDKAIGAFLHVDADGSLKAAAEAASHLERPLAGVPIAIKDNISTAGMPTTCGSRILRGYSPPYDATAVRRLKEAGAVIVGKTNCDEFGMGSSTEHSAYKLTRNPLDLERSPGGSSGGSAAAVAAGFVFGALGSDTGGSIRQPASFCGVSGLKPNYGRVSRYGLAAFGSSLDVVGPLGRTPEDCALILNVIAGKDPADSTTAPEPAPDFAAGAAAPFARFRVGLPVEYFAEGLDPEVRALTQRALAWLQDSGKAELKKIDLPYTRYAIPVYYIIASAEASSNLARYDGVRYGERAAGGSLREMYETTRAEGLGAEVKRRIMLGTFALSTGYYDQYYGHAQRVRSLVASDFEQAFKEVDLICTPTSPTPAFRLGEKLNDPLSMYLSDVYTATASLAGLPAMSVPCGLTAAGLPVGLQIIGNCFDEVRVLQLASFYFSASPR